MFPRYFAAQQIEIDLSRFTPLGTRANGWRTQVWASHNFCLCGNYKALIVSSSVREVFKTSHICRKSREQTMRLCTMRAKRTNLKTCVPQEFQAVDGVVLLKSAKASPYLVGLFPPTYPGFVCWPLPCLFRSFLTSGLGEATKGIFLRFLCRKLQSHCTPSKENAIKRKTELQKCFWQEIFHEGCNLTFPVDSQTVVCWTTRERDRKRDFWGR